MDPGKENQGVRREEEVDAMALLRVLSGKARKILGVTAASAVIALIVSLLLPVYYRAETKILPPQEKGNNLAAQLLGQAGGLISLAMGGAVGVKSQGELFVEMTKSRTILDHMVDRFELMKRYDEKYRQDARKRLLELLTVREERKSGIITLTVEDRDPKRASDMANAFIEELKSLAGALALSEAAQRRLFFEEQVAQAKKALSQSEDEIKAFQQRTGMFQIDAQARAIIEGIARLHAAIAAKEVEAKVLSSFATAQNPDVQRVEEEIEALRAQLAKTESSKGAGFDPIMPSGRVPALGTEYLRKLRQLKYNETLFELLSKQYELAKLEEARDAVVIQVIDRAVQPEKKFRPKRALIVILSTFIGLFLSIGIFSFLEVKKSKATRTHTD